MGNLTPRRNTLRKPRRERSRRVTIASLSGLAAVTLGLSGLALLSQSDSIEGGNGGFGSTATKSTNETVSPGDGEPGASIDSEENPAAGSVARSTRLLSVSDDPDRLLRAEGTACGGGSALLELSSDGGASWTSSDTSQIEVAGVRQLQFGENGRVQLAYANEQCSLRFARSYVYGGAWEAGSGAGVLWTLGTSEKRDDVTVAHINIDTPCPVVGIAGASELGIVLCDDATVSVSKNSGQSWSDRVTVAGAQAVAVDEESFTIASIEAAGCNGLTVRSFDGSSLGEPGECAEGDFARGDIAMSVGGGTLYIWANDKIVRSESGGSKWE